MGNELVTVSELDRQISRIETPIEALSLKDQAKRCEEAAKLLGLSLEEVNEYAERYMQCAWVHGDLVKDAPAHGNGGKLTTTDRSVDEQKQQRREQNQRAYSRKFRRAFDLEKNDAFAEIRSLVNEATDEGIQASIAKFLTYNHRAQGTGENEWYTPAEYIDAARAVLGGIALDPASSDKAQETVKADRYFTVADDALEKSWEAETVFLNPPYSQPHIMNFVAKLVDEINALRVDSAILLTHNYTDTAWFHLAESGATAICFTRGRIPFVNPRGQPAQPTQGQAFFYFGREAEAFAKEFSRYGFIR